LRRTRIQQGEVRVINKCQIDRKKKGKSFSGKSFLTTGDEPAGRDRDQLKIG